MPTKLETYAYNDIPKERIRCIDTETTGLTPGKDEILQVSVVDGNGDEVFSSYIKPDHRKRWPKAQEVNGITPAMVKDKPTLEEVGKDLANALDCDLIIGYNLPFDVGMLEGSGFEMPKTEQLDIMQWYAEKHGKWIESRNDYAWVKLVTAADHYGYEFDPHDALADAKATVAVFDGLLEEDVARWRQWDAEEPAREAAHQKAEQERLEKEAKEKHDKRVKHIGCAVVLIVVILWLGSCLASCFS